MPKRSTAMKDDLADALERTRRELRQVERRLTKLEGHRPQPARGEAPPKAIAWGARDSLREIEAFFDAAPPSAWRGVPKNAAERHGQHAYD